MKKRTKETNSHWFPKSQEIVVKRKKKQQGYLCVSLVTNNAYSLRLILKCFYDKFIIKFPEINSTSENCRANEDGINFKCNM